METKVWNPFPGALVRCTDGEDGYVLEFWRNPTGTEVWEYFISGVPVNETLTELVTMMENSLRPPTVTKLPRS